MISRTVILETEKAISFGFNLLKNKCIKFICYCRLLDYHDLSTRMIAILNRVQDCRYQKFSHTKLISLFFEILSNARPKNNVNQVPRWVFCVTCVEFMYLCRHVSVILVLLMCVMVLFRHAFVTFVMQMYFTHMLVTQSWVTQQLLHVNAFHVNEIT